MSDLKIKITHSCIMHPTMNLRWKECSQSLIGKTIEDEEYGRGTIIGEESRFITVLLDSPNCRVLVVPKKSLIANNSLTQDTRKLQQAFMCQGCGKTEWRELPIEKEEV